MVAVTRFEKFTRTCLHLAVSRLRSDNTGQPAPRDRVACDAGHRGREAGALLQPQRGVQCVDREPVLVPVARARRSVADRAPAVDRLQRARRKVVRLDVRNLRVDVKHNPVDIGSNRGVGIVDDQRQRPGGAQGHAGPADRRGLVPIPAGVLARNRPPLTELGAGHGHHLRIALAQGRWPGEQAAAAERHGGGHRRGPQARPAEHAITPDQPYLYIPPSQARPCTYIPPRHARPSTYIRPSTPAPAPIFAPPRSPLHPPRPPSPSTTGEPCRRPSRLLPRSSRRLILRSRNWQAGCGAEWHHGRPRARPPAGRRLSAFRALRPAGLNILLEELAPRRGLTEVVLTGDKDRGRAPASVSRDQAGNTACSCGTCRARCWPGRGHSRQTRAGGGPSYAPARPAARKERRCTSCASSQSARTAPTPFSRSRDGAGATPCRSTTA